MREETERPHLAAYAHWEYFVDVNLTEQQFQRSIRAALPDLATTDDEIDAFRDDIQWLLGRAVGQREWEQYRTTRDRLASRLDELHQSLAIAAEILASTGKKQTKIDSDVLAFVVKAGATEATPDARSIFDELVACRNAVEPALRRVACARSELKEISGAGRPPLFWYEPVVEGALLLAKRFSVPLTTAGDRTDDQHATPFTRLVHALEEFLPVKMRCGQLSACAKRIERSSSYTKARK